MEEAAQRQHLRLDENIDQFDLTPRDVIRAFIEPVDDLGLPHPAHIHCNNLGIPAMPRPPSTPCAPLEGRRVHSPMSSSTATGASRGKNPTSRGPEIAEYINSHPNITADVGQVMFGKATAMTADAPLGYLLNGYPAANGSMPTLKTRAGAASCPSPTRNKSFVHALQWAIGLELFLLSKDPWRIVLWHRSPQRRLLHGVSRSSFASSWTASSATTRCRRSTRGPSRKTCLGDDLDREYTLEEIAIITPRRPGAGAGSQGQGASGRRRRRRHHYLRG